MDQEKLPERTRVEIWSRTMGYYRPLSNFNIGKKAEYISRKHFKECINANSKFTQQYKILYS